MARSVPGGKGKHAEETSGEEQFAQLTTYKDKNGDIKLSHSEPAIVELLEIQKDRNQQMGKSPSPEEELGAIEIELTHRYRLQRFNAFEIGKLYHRAKELLPYGEFGEWVDKTGLYSRSAVNGYANVYKKCFGRPELLESIPPTLSLMICQPAFPDEVCENQPFQM